MLKCDHGDDGGKNINLCKGAYFSKELHRIGRDGWLKRFTGQTQLREQKQTNGRKEPTTTNITENKNHNITKNKNQQKGEHEPTTNMNKNQKKNTGEQRPTT